MPTQGVKRFNQVIMDLDAMVYTRLKSKYSPCPLESGYVASTNASWVLHPSKKLKQMLSERTGYFLLMQHGDEVLSSQRPSSGSWDGLYCSSQFDDEDGLYNQLAQRQINADNLTQLNAFRHTFSYLHLDIAPTWLPVSSSTSRMDEGNAFWYNLAQPPPVGLAVPVEHLLQQLRADTHV